LFPNNNCDPFWFWIGCFQYICNKTLRKNSESWFSIPILCLRSSIDFPSLPFPPTFPQFPLYRNPKNHKTAMIWFLWTELNWLGADYVHAKELELKSSKGVTTVIWKIHKEANNQKGVPRLLSLEPVSRFFPFVRLVMAFQILGVTFPGFSMAWQSVVGNDGSVQIGVTPPWTGSLLYSSPKRPQDRNLAPLILFLNSLNQSTGQHYSSFNLNERFINSQTMIL